MRLITRNEHHWTRRDGLDILKRVEVDELDVARRRWIGSDVP
jgi:hypothetical protein